MITITDPKKPSPAPSSLYPYGYRYVFHKFPNGKTITDRVALTLEDVLHPQLGDVHLESSLNEVIRRYLADVFSGRLVNDASALVLSACAIYWDDPELDHHSPDISVIFGVHRKKDNWTSFDVAVEGVRPRLLLEVVSPRSRENDVVTKVDHYHRAQVPWYIIVDREKEDSPLTLLGYHYTQSQYVPMAADDQGRLWLEPLGLWLGIKANRVMCYDGVSGEAIGNYQMVYQKMAEERTRADGEKTRADEEKTRADEEKTRADEEKTRADGEKTRADNAETRLRELEAELERLRRSNHP